jgi:hypothetical protein
LRFGCVSIGRRVVIYAAGGVKKQPVGHALEWSAANRLSSLLLDPGAGQDAGVTGDYRPQGVGVAGAGAAACGFFVGFLAADFFEPFAFADRFFGDFLAVFFLAADFFFGDFFAVFLAAFFLAISIGSFRL